MQRGECESDLVLADEAIADICDEANWQINSCINENDFMYQQLTQIEEALSECLKSDDSAGDNLRRLRESEQALRLQLDSEIKAHDIEIQLLKDRLAVRVLDKVLFKSGSAEILPAGIAVLNKITTVISASEYTIRIEGHTDNVPIGQTLQARFSSNWELSATRAASVIHYMQFHHKIDPQRLTLLGLSQYRPITDNDNAENRQRNRRVEIVLGAPR